MVQLQAILPFPEGQISFVQLLSLLTRLLREEILVERGKGTRNVVRRRRRERKGNQLLVDYAFSIVIE